MSLWSKSDIDVLDVCLSLASRHTVPKIVLCTGPPCCPGKGNQRSSSSAGNIVSLRREVKERERESEMKQKERRRDRAEDKQRKSEKLGKLAEYYWHVCTFLHHQLSLWCLDPPVARQVEIGDVGEKESSVGRKAGKTVIVETQSLKAGHVSEPFPGEGCEEVPIQSQLSQGLQVDKAAGVDGCDGVVGQPQKPQLWQVVEGCPGHSGDQGLLKTQFDCVSWDIDGNSWDSRVTALH